MTASITRVGTARRNWALVLLVLLVLTAFVALCLAVSDVERIVATGPILTILGLTLAFVTLPLTSTVVLLFSLSAPFVCVLGAFMIAVFHMSTHQAEGPVSVILALYGLFVVLPLLPMVLVRIRHWPAYRP